MLAQGGIEFGRSHYPAIVAFHAAWLLGLLVAIPPRTPLSAPLLAAFALLQCGRLWTMASLGRFWTTRIVRVPGTALVRRGPYRWLDHPAYLVVALEIPLVPLMFGAWRFAAVAFALKAALLWVRIRVENRALAETARNAETV